LGKSLKKQDWKMKGETQSHYLTNLKNRKEWFA